MFPASGNVDVFPPMHGVSSTLRKDSIGRVGLRRRRTSEKSILIHKNYYSSVKHIVIIKGTSQPSWICTTWDGLVSLRVASTRCRPSEFSLRLNAQNHLSTVTPFSCMLVDIPWIFLFCSLCSLVTSWSSGLGKFFFCSSCFQSSGMFILSNKGAYLETRLKFGGLNLCTVYGLEGLHRPPEGSESKKIFGKRGVGNAA